jgi:quercetin dioxygenase-like cupin family protein
MRHAVAKRNAGSGEWKPIKSLPGVTYLTLNKDETHGVTRLVKFSKGYEVEKSLHDGTVELFVLDGQFQVGPMTYGPGDYFCVPGGVAHGPERALTDVTILRALAPHPALSPRGRGTSRR